MKLKKWTASAISFSMFTSVFTINTNAVADETEQIRYYSKFTLQMNAKVI